MSPHNVTNEQLVQFVLGELTSEKACEIELHLHEVNHADRRSGRCNRCSTVPDA